MASTNASALATERLTTERSSGTVAFRELLLRVQAACEHVDQRLAARTRHGPGAANTRLFLISEVRRLSGLVFFPPGLFAAGNAQADTSSDPVDAAMSFFETHGRQTRGLMEYLFTTNEMLAVRAWTVLESTARYVWVHALDHHPIAARDFWPEAPLPRLVAKNNKASRARKRPKAIPEKIGTALSELSFSNPDALGERFAPFNEPFAVELRTNASLRALNAARHIIVHKAGVIDDKFIEDTGMKVQAGYRLGPRFSDVASWIEATTYFALACLDVVDAWEQRIDPESTLAWPPDFAASHS